MERDSTLAIGPLVRLREWIRSVTAELDTTLLKRVGVATYFGVYAVIAFGGRRTLNQLLGALPDAIQPAAFAPVHVALGLPRSVAWALVSFTTSLVVIGALVAVSLHREAGDRPPQLGETPLRERVAPGAAVRAVGRRVHDAVVRATAAVSAFRRPSSDGGASTDVEFPSPSTDGGATVLAGASAERGHDDGRAGDLRDGASDAGSAVAPPTADPLAPFSDDDAGGTQPAEAVSSVAPGTGTDFVPAEPAIEPVADRKPDADRESTVDDVPEVDDELTMNETSVPDVEPGADDGREVDDDLEADVHADRDDAEIVDAGETADTDAEPVPTSVAAASDGAEVLTDEASDADESGADRGASARADADDAGSDAADAEPDAAAAWPSEREDEAESAEDAEEPDEEAPWPEGWISGDEL